jgi:hypothetical protein
MARVGCSYVLILRQCKERNHTVNNRKRKSPLTADWGFETERKTLLQGGYVHRTPYTVHRLPYRVHQYTIPKIVQLIIGQNLKCLSLLVSPNFIFFSLTFKIKATAVPILNFNC